MNCIKCGREIPADQVFCPECLEDMAKHPVKPGTAVRIPPPPETLPQPRRSAAPRKIRKPEEQIRSLKKTIGWLITLIVILVLALAATIFLLLRPAEQNEDPYKNGGNFTSRDDETAAWYVSRETFEKGAGL